MEELRRRMASAKSWGVEDCRLVTPAEIKELVPFVDESILLGGFYSPSVAVVDSLRFGTIMRERAQEKGAQVLANTEVLGIDVEDGRVRRVRTTRGDFDADIVAIACGVWSPRIAQMAGASIPLTPAVHQMIDVGPVPRFLDSKTRGRLPDRARHGHEHVRAAGRPGTRGRLVRPPPDPPRARRDPLDRGGGAHADRAAVHAGGLRAPARARARARAGGARRRVGRDQVRDQRPPLPHARRPAAARRDARGAEGSGRRPRSGSRKGPASASRSRSGWCTASPRSTSSRRTSRASIRSSARREHVKGRARRGLQQDLRDRPPGRAVGVEPRRPRLPLLRARDSSSAPSSSRRRPGSGRTGTSRTRRSWTSTACSRASTSGTRAGGRRSSTPSTSPCASARRCST